MAADYQADIVTSASFAATGSSTGSSFPIASTNTSRKTFSLYNNCSSSLYVKLGGPASSQVMTVTLALGGLYEMPAPVYTGQVWGLFAATGSGLANAFDMF